jgi:hypothetical protein
VSVEAPVLVVCGECGARFQLSARNARERRRRRQSPICAECRNPSKPVDEATMERMRRWWLARYSIEELLELGREIGWC